MNPETLKRLQIIATAAGAAVLVRIAAFVAGIDLELKESAATDGVGIVDVLIASVLAGLGAWAVHAFLIRQDKARYWPFVATTVLAISMSGPGYLADGATAMVLMAMHLAVAIPLILGFARLAPSGWHDHRNGYRPRIVAPPQR